MTRLLSEILGVDGHALQQGLQRLERASGHESSDIRLSADVLQATKRKIAELGLDPHDTTGAELYAALKRRLEADDAKLVATLRERAGSEDTVDMVSHALRSVVTPGGSFGLKVTAAKALLKKQPPKQTMRQLGYRSLESMLKHEPVSALYAAAWLLESTTWRRSFYDGYKKLKSSDFETRDIIITTPDSERWQKLASKLVSARKHTVVALKELATIVLLPLPADVPAAVTTTTLILSLHSMNEIRAASTFLKLSQVKANFGTIVQQIISNEPYLSAALLDQQVPWQILQRYYARFQDAFRADIFEPHVQQADLSWHAVEDVLESIESNLGFWRGTDYLAMIDDSQPVSLNMIDVALAVGNRLPYEQRVVQYLRHSLWHELLLKYLKHDSVEQAVIGQLDGELATEPVLI